jgi:hypothetical protein
LKCILSNCWQWGVCVRIWQLISNLCVMTKRKHRLD